MFLNLQKNTVLIYTNNRYVNKMMSIGNESGFTYFRPIRVLPFSFKIILLCQIINQENIDWVLKSPDLPEQGWYLYCSPRSDIIGALAIQIVVFCCEHFLFINFTLAIDWVAVEHIIKHKILICTGSLVLNLRSLDSMLIPPVILNEC